MFSADGVDAFGGEVGGGVEGSASTSISNSGGGSGRGSSEGLILSTPDLLSDNSTSSSYPSSKRTRKVHSGLLRRLLMPTFFCETSSTTPRQNCLLYRDPSDPL